MVNIHLEVFDILLRVTGSREIYSKAFARCRMISRVWHIFLLINIMTGATYRVLATELLGQHLSIISCSLVQKYLQLLFPSCHHRFAAVNKVYRMMLIFHEFISVAHRAEGIEDIMLVLFALQTFHRYL